MFNCADLREKRLVFKRQAIGAVIFYKGDNHA